MKLPEKAEVLLRKSSTSLCFDQTMELDSVLFSLNVASHYSQSPYGVITELP
jgi:hypothetical protein